MRTSSIAERLRKPIDIAIGDGMDHPAAMMTVVETNLEGGGETGFAYVPLYSYCIPISERTNDLRLTLF